MQERESTADRSEKIGRESDIGETALTIALIKYGKKESCYLFPRREQGKLRGQRDLRTSRGRYVFPELFCHGMDSGKTRAEQFKRKRALSGKLPQIFGKSTVGCNEGSIRSEGLG
jgi:hypothetical protein